MRLVVLTGSQFHALDASCRALRAIRRRSRSVGRASPDQGTTSSMSIPSCSRARRSRARRRASRRRGGSRPFVDPIAASLRPRGDRDAVCPRSETSRSTTRRIASLPMPRCGRRGRRTGRSTRGGTAARAPRELDQPGDRAATSIGGGSRRARRAAEVVLHGEPHGSTSGVSGMREGLRRRAAPAPAGITPPSSASAGASARRDLLRGGSSARSASRPKQTAPS
jgi:hypothetical protein